MATAITLESLMNTTSGMDLLNSTILTKGKTQVFESYQISYAHMPYGRWWYSQAQRAFDDEISNVAVEYDGSILFTLKNNSSIGECEAFYIDGVRATKEIYSQRGTLDTGEYFYKIRVHGTTINTNLASYNTDTIYEIFLISGDKNKQIVFNLVKIANSNYLIMYERVLNAGSGNKYIGTKLPIKANTPSQIYLTYAGAGDKWTITTSLFSTVTLDLLLGTNYFLYGDFGSSAKVDSSNFFDFFKIGNAALSTVTGYGRGLVTLQNSNNKILLWNTKGGSYYSYSVAYTRDTPGLVLNDESRFFKMRGRMSTGSSGEDQLFYEMYLLNNQKILLYIVKIPSKDEGATGEHYINLFGVNTPLGEITAGEKIWIYLDDTGTSYAVKTGEDSDVSKIEILTLPTENKFYLGSKLNIEGLTARVTFEDSTTFDILKFDDSDISYTNALGTQDVTVTFRGKTATFQTECLEDKIASIDFTISQDHYMVGESLGYIRVTATRLSGKTETISTDNCTISGYDLNTPGTQTVTVTYGEITAEKNILVDSPETATLTVTNSLTDPFLMKFDAFSSLGVSASLTYSDGYSETVGNLEYSGYDNDTAGEKTITVSYRGATATYTVQVVEEIVRQLSENITMAINGTAGKVTISGLGDIPSNSSMFANPHESDWRGTGYKNAVKTVEIGEGITSVYGFNYCINLINIKLPESLNTIAYDAFYGCTNLLEVALPENVTQINSSAFASCTNMILTINNAECKIYDNNSTIQAKRIRGHIDSTAQNYAKKYSIEFESFETVTKIEVTKKPGKIYHTGETLSKNDIEVTATFDTGDSRTINSYELEYDFSSTGEKTVKAVYGDFSDSFTVNIVAYNFQELINTTEGMQVIRNTKNDDGTDTVDGVDWFKFNNVTADKMYINGNNWIGFGVSSEQLKICRRDGAVWNVYRLETVLDNNVKLLKIRVEGYTYYGASGEHESQIKYELFLFDNGDMYLNVLQSPDATSSYAGTSSLLSNSKTTDLSLNGATEEKPAKVSFLHQDESGLEWKTAYRTYKFSTLTGIRIEALPDKTKYKVNETFDSSGLTVVAVYDNGETETIVDYTLAQPDMTSYGTKSVIVTYETLTATFEITVIDATGIEVTTFPDRTRYYEDETFLPAGLTVSQVYTDGSKETISGYTLSAPDMSAGGDKTISVAYNNFTTSFEITVIGISGIEITKAPVKEEYCTGDSLDTTGLTVALKYTDGTSKTLAEYTVSGFDSVNAGEKTVIVTYKTHTASFEVTVYTASGIRIASLPNRVYYKIGEAIDLTGLVVMLIRNDGTEEEIRDYEVNGFDSSKAGSKTITVFYNKDINGITTYIGSDTFQIKVTNDGTNPFEEEAGDISVTVHWINGEFEDLTSENNTIQSSSLVLQESICSESYFIFGGCISNQITFKAHHTQFDSVEEEFYPSGKIEVYLKCKDTEVKIFTGEIASAERDSDSWVRTFIAYDYLYNLQNTDIAWWYKNQTTDKNKLLTQKQFRDALFKYIGIEQVETKLHWDDTYVPNDQNSNEMKVTNILKDLCLQNDRFGHINRDGKFEYLKLRQNTYKYGESTSGKKLYKYYNNAEIHLDTFKSFWAKEGRIWFPNVIHTDPDPNRAYGFTEGEMTAQEAYENNVFYNRNSFFVGNEDWLNYVWDADEYKQISRKEPIMKICYGTFINLDLRKFYRAQGYKVEIVGNPLNTVGQTIELRTTKQLADGTELEWFVHSYIMSRTLKLGNSKLIDTYSANNAPFNGNTRQLGNNTPEISATVNRTRAEMPVVSYGFSDGTSDFTAAASTSGGTVKKTALRCMKRIEKDDYDKLPVAIRTRDDTIFMTYKES